MLRFLAPLLFGLIGAGILVWLGVWQMQRLEWKEGVLAEIESEIAAAPVPLPDAVSADTHKYLPVTTQGRFAEGALRVLVSRKQIGAGYRVISPFEVEGRRIMVDRGFLRVDDPLPDAPEGMLTLAGNLHWPEDRLSSTPENDVAGNTWFARDLAPMAAALEAEPVLLVAREMSAPDGAVRPMPVDTSGIPNDHLSYAVTWFSLAVIWLMMTGYYIWRLRAASKGTTA